MSDLQEETERMRAEIEHSRTRAKIFQGLKCRACPHNLTLPAVHFLCMHSYHQRCVGDDTQCPECAPEYSKVRRLKESMKESGINADRFNKELDGSPDGFNVVAEYFGRGLFDVGDRKQ